MFIAKLCMFYAFITADANDDARMTQKLVFVIGKIGRFQRADRRIDSGVKKEDKVILAMKLGNIDGLHIRIGEDEHRCHLSNFHHFSLLKDANRSQQSNRGSPILTKLLAPDYQKQTPTARTIRTLQKRPAV